MRKRKETEDDREQIAARNIERENRTPFKSRALDFFQASRIYFGAQKEKMSSVCFEQNNVLGCSGREERQHDSRSSTCN